MGFGDALIAAGVAERVVREDPLHVPVTIVEATGLPRWHYLWESNPAIVVPQAPLSHFPQPYVRIGKGCLPYLAYPYSEHTGWRFTDWRAADHRPTLYLSAREQAKVLALQRIHGDYVLIEPTPVTKPVNRRPPLAFWHLLADRLRPTLGPTRLVQLGHEHAHYVPGLVRIEQIHPLDFRDACTILAGARLFIGTEGGLAHAAAALRIPAVILWGGCISAAALGYPDHVNLVDDQPETPCGALAPCLHCGEAWMRLEPAAVADAVLQEYARGLAQSRR